jgi:L-amino acid N-acyltransferase YncA
VGDRPARRRPRRPPLTTPTGVVVRPAVPRDAEAIAQIYGAAVADTTSSFEAVPPSPDEMRERMGKSPRLPWFVAEAPDGSLLGFAYGSRHRERAAYRWSAEVSVYNRAEARRQGIGSALYAALFPALRELGYVSLYAGITLPNPASVGLHRHLGFREIGTFPMVGFKFGQWHDTNWWWLPLQDRPVSPAEPREWPTPV